jgi:ubiquinone/menaquinone biosynthesis C-methylase UbiE
MYSQSAAVYDALSRHKDYGAAAATLSRILLDLVGPGASLLDVACGTGRHLERLREHFQVAGLDQSEDMLRVARQRCPGIDLHVGDMRTFSLDGQFDAITCLFGSIAYATTLADLAHSLRNVVRHLKPGGALVIEPWLAPERFISGRLVFDTIDDPDLKVARVYVTRDEQGRVAVYDMQYLVATTEGVRHFTEVERLGLFTHEEYLHVLRDAGVSVRQSTGDLFGYGLFVGVLEK